MKSDTGHKSARALANPVAGSGFAALFFLSACVSNSGTIALTSVEIEAKQLSHEQKFVASKCNSANRLGSSNLASQAMNAKFTTYGAQEGSLDQAQKDTFTTQMETRSTRLQALDHDLNIQCKAFSACEYQASLDKRSCNVQKAKFIESEKMMTQFTRQIEGIKIN